MVEGKKKKRDIWEDDFADQSGAELGSEVEAGMVPTHGTQRSWGWGNFSSGLWSWIGRSSMMTSARHHGAGFLIDVGLTHHKPIWRTNWWSGMGPESVESPPGVSLNGILLSYDGRKQEYKTKSRKPSWVCRTSGCAMIHAFKKIDWSMNPAYRALYDCRGKKLPSSKKILLLKHSSLGSEPLQTNIFK